MKKATSSAVQAAETTAAAVDGGAVDYRVKPGVQWVNGRRVGNERTVSLNDQEAAYDLGLGRISPASKPVPKDWPAPATEAGARDGGN
ncbi:MAG: hypothetical protein V7774_08915 [Pseudorhizobium pelagicum]|uniref:hypothetical protein n=1 Tax=Pseudorhizobium pelagicum TaxID=1509405 RepID=UPI00346106AD